MTSMGPSHTAAIERGSPIATNGGSRSSSRESQHFAITSGPIPAGSPREIASGGGGVAGMEPALIANGRSAVFDHCVAAKVRQIAASARVHPVPVYLVVDVVIAWRVRVGLIAAETHHPPTRILDRPEGNAGLPDLQRQHELREGGRQIADFGVVALHAPGVEGRCPLPGSAAAADIARGGHELF